MMLPQHQVPTGGPSSTICASQKDQIVERSNSAGFALTGRLLERLSSVVVMPAPGAARAVQLGSADGRSRPRLQYRWAKNLSVDLTANVKTREMEAFNKQFSCRFKLTPAS